MKEKKHKYIEDLLDQYFQLSDEQIEIPLLIERAKKKFDQHLSPQKDTTYIHSEAGNLFKFHIQVKKYEERKKEVGDELSEVENLIKDFLLTLQGGKISYKKKDDNNKSKNIYLFWMEGDKVKCNRQN